MKSVFSEFDHYEGLGAVGLVVVMLVIGVTHRAAARRKARP